MKNRTVSIDWNPPAVRQGVAGRWDSFVGPGATKAEEWLQLLLGSAIAVVCIAVFYTSSTKAITWYHTLIVVALALDIGGGIVTNATNSAKRWYHRPGYPMRKHIAFVALHGLHLVLAGIFFSMNPVAFALSTLGFLALASAAILSVPLYLQRPMAFGVAAIGLALSQLPILQLDGLAWMLPLLTLKLLLGHLIKEAPFRPHTTL